MNYRGLDYYRFIQACPEIKEEMLHSARYGVKEKISEKLVQSIWYDQRINVDQLMLDDGRKIKIFYPGSWNTEGGPDFKDAQLMIASGEKLTGDIEVHLLASHWIAHRHQENRLYDKVILHICMWNDLPKGEGLLTPSGEALPQLTLINFLDRELNDLSTLIDPQDYPYTAKSALGSCQSILSSLSLEQSGKLLDLAGEARMEEKVSRMAIKQKGESYNQLLYEGIMEALGYKNNKESFRQLAERANLSLMKELIAENKKTPPLPIIQSWLLGLAGFLPIEQEELKGTDFSDDKYLEELKRQWGSLSPRFKQSPLPRDFWERSMRPANIPARRLVGMSHILTRAGNLDLVGYFSSAFDEADISLERRGFIRLNQILKQKLMSPLEDFWGWYYKPGGAVLNHPARTIGQSRAMVIIVNIIIPFYLFVARQRGDGELHYLLWHFYEWYPKLPENSMTRLMRYRLFGEAEGGSKIINSASRQLGLIQIFKDFCSLSLKNCGQCDFVKALEQGRAFLLK